MAPEQALATILLERAWTAHTCCHDCPMHQAQSCNDWQEHFCSILLSDARDCPAMQFEVEAFIDERFTAEEQAWLIRYNLADPTGIAQLTYADEFGCTLTQAQAAFDLWRQLDLLNPNY